MNLQQITKIRDLIISGKTCSRELDVQLFRCFEKRDAWQTSREENYFDVFNIKHVHGPRYVYRETDAFVWAKVNGSEQIEEIESLAEVPMFLEKTKDALRFKDCYLPPRNRLEIRELEQEFSVLWQVRIMSDEAVSEPVQSDELATAIILAVLERLLSEPIFIQRLNTAPRLSLF